MSFVIRRYRCVQVIVCIMLMVSVWSTPVHAQFTDVWSAEKLQTGQLTNLFASWNGSEAFHGIFVTLPVGWTLKDADILRYGYEHIPVQVSRDSAPGKYIISASRRMVGPHELVLRVETGPLPGYYDWSLTPFIRQNDGLQARIVTRDAFFVSRAVRLERADTVANNRILFFEEKDGGPLLLRGEALPDLDTHASYTLEFWMKTTHLDEVVLSSWNGSEASAYPFELVVDASGRLAFYYGQPGNHQFMTTHVPIAEGSWHHVAVTNDPEKELLSLLLDGQRVDSLRNTLMMTQGRLPVVAVGGRIPSRSGTEDGSSMSYTGMLDELNFWPSTRSEAIIRQTMRQPASQSSDDCVHLGFEEELPDRILERRSPRTRRILSDLGFYHPIQHLNATVDTPNVRITWDARDEQVVAFAVERSTNGTDFNEIGRIEAEKVDNRNTYRYLDATATSQVLFYRIRQLFSDGTERLSGTIKMGLGEEVHSVSLVGNFPNPFNASTTITYEVHESEYIRLSIWDLSGQSIEELVNGIQDPGVYEVHFNANDLPSGTYFVRMQTPEGLQSSKMILMK